MLFFNDCTAVAIPIAIVISSLITGIITFLITNEEKIQQTFNSVW